ncbi:MAG: hypothetical protein ACI4W6_04460 [Acutalibacteraceae bacterium]
MKKIFISQPMRGKSEQEIRAERKIIIEKVKQIFGEDAEILGNFFPDFRGNALECFAKSISVLTEADAAVFAKHWEDNRGCVLEHKICKDYNVPTLEL